MHDLQMIDNKVKYAAFTLQEWTHTKIIAVSIPAHYVTLVLVQIRIPLPRLPSGTLTGGRIGTWVTKAEQVVARFAQKKLRKY